MNTNFAVATHIVTYLAFARENAASSEQIAEHLHTNPVVVRRLISLLREAGLVKTKLGARGGALLARCPTKISLRDIYEAIAGDDADLFALSAAQKEGCNRIMASVQATLEDICASAEETMKRAFGKVSVAQIIERSSSFPT